MSAACVTPAPASFAPDHVPDPTGSALRRDAMFEVSAVSVGSRGSWLGTAGEVDLATAGHLGSVLEQQCQAGRCFARLDLSAVSFMDCAGLGVLVGAHHRFLAAGGTLILTGVGPRIARLLELTGLDQTLFTIARATDPPLTQSADTQNADQASQAQAGMAVRAVVDQAVGIVMGRAGCTVVQATERLQTLSRSTSRTLAEVGQSILDEPARARRWPARCSVPGLRRRPGEAGVQIALQPIVEVGSGAIYAVEALARFPNSPDTPVDEVFADARGVGRGPALEAACLRAALLQRENIPPGILLAVNVSPGALSHPAVVRALSGDLSGVIVEITEQPAHNVEALRVSLRGLRRRGALIAVDDAGVGCADLRRVGTLRPDIVKLDRVLITRVADRASQAAAVAALAGLSRRIGATIVAEGVEAIEDLRGVAASGADYAQGWLTGPPAPPPLSGLAMPAAH